jgi:hypothetical protein
VLRKLQRRAAVADREVSSIEGTGLALAELRLQRPGVHAVDKIEGPRTELDLLAAAVFAIVILTSPRARRRAGDDESRHRRGALERDKPVSHFTLHWKDESYVPTHSGSRARQRRPARRLVSAFSEVTAAASQPSAI